MERTHILDLMGELKLYGMRAAFDEVISHAVKRRHEPPRVVGDLLKAEIAEKQARSIKYALAERAAPRDCNISRGPIDGRYIGVRCAWAPGDRRDQA
jgi:hypothetical protein